VRFKDVILGGVDRRALTEVDAIRTEHVITKFQLLILLIFQRAANEGVGESRFELGRRFEGQSSFVLHDSPGLRVRSMELDLDCETAD
jgi:hypothetical protein